MEIIIITGMSGSGKSEAMNIIEDMGYYCVDNLPPMLIYKFVMLGFSGSQLNKIALGVDSRGFKKYKELGQALEFLDESAINYKILFLEARDEVLVRRYKMSRRKHPLSGGDDILGGIVKERELLSQLKEKSDYVIDTSDLLPIDLRNKILDIFQKRSSKTNMTVTVMSFGFKYGIPIDADLVFDVRFLPNPYYVDSLKNLNGCDKAVSDYVMNSSESLEFFDRLSDFVKYLLPKYIKEGKNQLLVAIGCTGGRHRSVTIANKIYEDIKNENFSVFIKHRDIKK